MSSAGRWKRVLWPIVLGILLLGLFVILVIGFCRKPSASVVVNARSDCVKFSLADRWIWNGEVRARSAFLRGLTAVDTALFRVAAPPVADGWIYLDAGDLALDFLDLGEGATVELYAPDPSQVDLDVRMAPISGRVQVKGKPRISAGSLAVGPIQTRDLHRPAPVEFSSPNGAGLHLGSRGVATLHNVPVKALAFSRRIAVSAGQWSERSFLYEARLVFPESGRDVSLLDGQSLVLEGVTGQVLSIQLGTEGLRIVFEGRVSRARTGSVSAPGGDLTPTVLECLYQWGHTEALPVVLLLYAGFLWSLLALYLSAREPSPLRQSQAAPEPTQAAASSTASNSSSSA
jgi:hypothetical protein